MRINIIGNHKPSTGVAQDVHILHGLLVHVLGKETEIRHIPHYYPECSEAEVNFFIEVINPCLLTYARKNIWIPNPEWTYQTWKPYASMVDEIWVKTQEALPLFQEWTDKVRCVGWTSIDKVMPEKKNYWKAIVPSGKNVWRNPKPIIQAYMRIRQQIPTLYKSLPELHIVWHLQLPPIPEEYNDKIKVHTEMKEKEYDELLQECGLSICLSASEGFGHAVNESLSAGCVTLLSPIEPFRQLTSQAIWVSNSKTTKHPTCLGVLEDVDIESVMDALKFYASSNFQWKRDKSAKGRDEYEKRHRAFVESFSTLLKETCEGVEEYSLEKCLPKEEDLPSISIITLTKDRRPFFPLAKYCFVAQGYPEEKLEWIIVDDGKDQIKDLVTDIPNAKYVLCDESREWTIGAKRNLGVERASHDVIVMMDDDDVYPNNSILTRVAMLLAEPKKGCVFSTTIPSFDIHEKKSWMNVPPITLPMAERVSEATLCFTREFWEQRKFPDIQIAEANAFISGREQMCREVSPQHVIVSLTHKKTTSSRKAPAGPSNGSHYGFSDDLYTLISEIAESI